MVYVYQPVGAVDNQTVDATTAKSFVVPVGARGFWISCKTAQIWITLDGSTAAANAGLIISAGVQPVFIPCAKDISAFGSAASCPTSVLWVG